MKPLSREGRSALCGGGTIPLSVTSSIATTAASTSSTTARDARGTLRGS